MSGKMLEKRSEILSKNDLMIKKAFHVLYNYLKKNEYRGWDPFDGLSSSIFKNSPLFNSRLFRILWLQFFKNSPINFRRVALIPKGINPKGLALFSSGLSKLKKLEEAHILLKKLRQDTVKESLNCFWGYNFDWQARAFYAPKETPNMVTTVFVINAFLDYFDRSEDPRALNISEIASEFILNSLISYEDPDRVCFSYIPGEKARVHNANMLGAALLARIFSYNGNKILFEKSRKAMTYSIDALTPEYYWPYGDLRHHQFVDNFHTGFNLVALKKWIDHTGDQIWTEQLQKAYDQFLDTFWLDNGCPRYYRDSLYPIDIHCSAQGIVTCLELEDYNPRSISIARKIAEWAVTNMQDRNGYFYYQKTRWYTNRIPYIRWSQAWMFYALAHFIVRLGEDEHKKDKSVRH